MSSARPLDVRTLGRPVDRGRTRRSAVASCLKAIRGAMTSTPCRSSRGFERAGGGRILGAWMPTPCQMPKIDFVNS